MICLSIFITPILKKHFQDRIILGSDFLNALAYINSFLFARDFLINFFLDKQSYPQKNNREIDQNPVFT